MKVWFLVTYDYSKHTIDMTPMESYGDAATAALREKRIARNLGKPLDFLVRSADVKIHHAD